MTEENRTYRPDQVAKLFEVKRRTVYRWIQRGMLNAFYTPGGDPRVSHEEIQRFRRAQTRAQKSTKGHS